MRVSLKHVWYDIGNKQAQMCAEVCEGAFLYSLISIRETAFQLKDV